MANSYARVFLGFLSNGDVQSPTNRSREEEWRFHLTGVFSTQTSQRPKRPLPYLRRLLPVGISWSTVASQATAATANATPTMRANGSMTTRHCMLASAQSASVFPGKTATSTPTISSNRSKLRLVARSAAIRRIAARATAARPKPNNTWPAVAQTAADPSACTQGVATVRKPTITRAATTVNTMSNGPV